MNTTLKTYAPTDVILARDIYRNLIKFVNPKAKTLTALPNQIAKGSLMYPLNSNDDWVAQIRKINEGFGKPTDVLNGYVATESSEPLFSYKTKAEQEFYCNAIIIVDEAKEHVSGDTPYADTEKDSLVGRWVYKFGNEDLKYRIVKNTDTGNICIVQDGTPPKKVDVDTLELYMYYRFEDGSTIAKRA